MKKALSILIIGAAVLSLGVNVAYYNTGMLLNDRANIISSSNESVKIYEYDIPYTVLKEKAEILKKTFKSEYITI